MDALKAKLPGASALAKQKMQRLGLESDPEKYREAGYQIGLADVLVLACHQHSEESEDLEEKLDFMLDVVNYASILAAKLMLAIEEQQRAAWDPTHPDHVGPTYGGR